MALNEAWHRVHPMPKNPTMEERIRWHEAHAAACGCRPIPDSVKATMAARNH